jgi:hypothetical protein
MLLRIDILDGAPTLTWLSPEPPNTEDVEVAEQLLNRAHRGPAIVSEIWQTDPFDYLAFKVHWERPPNSPWGPDWELSWLVKDDAVDVVPEDGLPLVSLDVVEAFMTGKIVLQSQN